MTTGASPDGTPGETPGIVLDRWPDAAETLSRYHRLLGTAGVERGLIGPREVPRLWDRHLLNCAVVAEAVPPAATVADVGSGAGLPGLVVAIVRPDCRVTLIEPLLRRATFLTETVAELGLADRVTVARARAEDWQGGTFDVVTARAVAPLERLVRWCLPLVSPTGALLALKGDRAAGEVAAAAADLSRMHAAATIRHVGAGVVAVPTTIVVVQRGAHRASPPGDA